MDSKGESDTTDHQVSAADELYFLCYNTRRRKSFAPRGDKCWEAEPHASTWT